MAFEEQLPQWENEGTQPPQSKRVEGWLPQEKPPASWFNWLFHRAYKALQELQQKAAEKEEVESVAQAADQAWDQAVLARSIAELHAARHATGGADPLTPEMIGAAPEMHASQHASDGSDPITPEDIGAASETDFASHVASSVHIGKNLYCRIRASANQTIPNATDTKLDLNTVVNDPYGMFDSTNKRIVVPETGVYLIVGIVSFAANTQGERQAIIKVNGTTVGRYRGAPNTGSGSPTQVGVSVVTSISAGGYVELFASQSSGGSLDVPSFGVEAPVLSVVRVA